MTTGSFRLVFTAGEACSPAIRAQDLSVDPFTLVACKKDGTTRDVHGEANAVERRDRRDDLSIHNRLARDKH